MPTGTGVGTGQETENAPMQRGPLALFAQGALQLGTTNGSRAGESKKKNADTDRPCGAHSSQELFTSVVSRSHETNSSPVFMILDVAGSGQANPPEMGRFPQKRLEIDLTDGGFAPVSSGCQ